MSITTYTLILNKQYSILFFIAIRTLIISNTNYLIVFNKYFFYNYFNTWNCTCTTIVTNAKSSNVFLAINKYIETPSTGLIN